ncbi:DUF3015 family protein [Salinisphaera sp.]|uniref:DUF3015 family protein n=1 Tax=Salinisphaera sp. TaxID=1914330 RepID=UPI002D79AC73|nr:DUF3015 family protein [Salinisphaera sp.]HET7314122.1 DUF3015 family protein [Salinisphaera sp.]
MIRLRHAAIAAAASLSTLAATPALAYDSHDFTTTASTAGTTAYIVGRANDDDFAAAHEFAHSQRVALRREAASGGGEHIDSLADLLGANDNQAFGHWMQRHYSALYPAHPAEANLVDRIVTLQHS